MIKAHQEKFRIKEIGVEHLPRKKGNSTVTLGKMLKSLSDLVRLRLSYI